MPEGKTTTTLDVMERQVEGLRCDDITAAAIGFIETGHMPQEIAVAIAKSGLRSRRAAIRRLIEGDVENVLSEGETNRLGYLVSRLDADEMSVVSFSHTVSERAPEFPERTAF